GDTHIANTKPPDLSDDAYKELDIVSAPLRSLDAHIRDQAGLRERSGNLALNKVDIVDRFGIRRSWTSPPPPNQPVIPLEPRLPYWSRLTFRLLSAAQPGQEAGPFATPVCGFLLPDPIEHALEVYDRDGRALGQLRSQPPQVSGQPGTVLGVWFEPLPWV